MRLECDHQSCLRAMSASSPLAIRIAAKRSGSRLGYPRGELVELPGAALDRAPVLLGLAHLVEDALSEIGRVDCCAFVAHRIQ